MNEKNDLLLIRSRPFSLIFVSPGLFLGKCLYNPNPVGWSQATTIFLFNEQTQNILFTIIYFLEPKNVVSILTFQNDLKSFFHGGSFSEIVFDYWLKLISEKLIF